MLEAILIGGTIVLIFIFMFNDSEHFDDDY